VISGIALNLVPGPDFLFIASRSAGQGIKAGIAASFGVGAGTLVHIFAAAFGISAVLAASPTAYQVIKILGGVYLLYMGITMLLSKTKSPTQNLVAAPKASLKRVFYQGFLTNTLNPKVALFFIAFVPQFIAPDSSNIIISFLVLGFIFSFNGLIWCLIVAWFSASAGAIIKHNQYLSITAKKLAGGLFTYFGLRLWFGSS
jgi:threonine/homoserine/homoserine lactone efflux protein